MKILFKKEFDEKIFISIKINQFKYFKNNNFPSSTFILHDLWMSSVFRSSVFWQINSINFHNKKLGVSQIKEGNLRKRRAKF